MQFQAYSSKPIAKPKHYRHHRPIPLHRLTCNSGTVMMASAVFFFLGLLRGRLTSPPIDHTQTAAPSPPQALQQESKTGSAQEPPSAVQQSTTQKAPEVQHARSDLEEQRVALPLVRPFAHGDSGEGSVEHIAFQVLSWKPRAYIFPHFADNATCDKIIALSKKSMTPSGLALKAGEKEEDQKDVRTSTGAYFMGRDDPSGALDWVEKKMSRVTAVPVDNGEPFNILRYAPGQRYQAHMDTFDPKDYGPQETNRIASFLLYLTDVEEGGETVFPQEGGVRRSQKWDECVGLKVKPRKGDALLFWSMTPMRQIDPDSLHAGCPVIKGEKWVATKWLRDGPNN